MKSRTLVINEGPKGSRSPNKQFGRCTIADGMLAQKHIVSSLGPSWTRSLHHRGVKWLSKSARTDGGAYL